MRLPSLALCVVVVVVPVIRLATAGDPPTPPPGTKPTDRPAPAKDSEPAYKGTEIQWVISVAEAFEEAAQRNVLVYVHSHGST